MHYIQSHKKTVLHHSLTNRFKVLNTSKSTSMSDFTNNSFDAGQQPEWFEFESSNNTSEFYHVNDTHANTENFNNTYYYNNGTNNNESYSRAFTEDQTETVKIISTSFYTPFIYGAILLISLFYFSKYYKQNKIKKLTQMKSIFDEQNARDLYFEIKQMKEDGKVKVHDKVLKAALLNRGAENIRRSFKLKELTPQVEILYKNGSIGEDYWKRFQTEIKIVEAELKECIMEAESLQPGWSQLYIALCQEICFNQALQRRYNSILERKNTCIKEWNLDIDKDGHLIGKAEQKS